MTLFKSIAKPLSRAGEIALLAALASVPASAAVAGPPSALRVSATTAAEAAEWDARIASLTGGGRLKIRQARADTLLPGREHLRLAQIHSGVPVYGGELVQQTDGRRTVSVFGMLYEGITIGTIPTLRPDQALDIVERLAGVDLGPPREPELLVLPLEQGGYALTWHTRAITPAGDYSEYFIDAGTGALVLKQSLLKHQSPPAAVGLGKGVLDDDKKMSASVPTGTTGFVSIDVQRPPSIITFDLKGNLDRLLGFLNGTLTLRQSDVASDSDNTWTDAAVVDAHTYAGYTYDYYFKRFGRRGLDNANIEMLSVVHPVRRENLDSTSSSLVNIFFLNAFYAGDGLMVYGEGLPTGRRDSSGHAWNYLAGALDVVAHELTHGVTEFSSRLQYQNESGALNESFSDMMGVSAEFFFQPAGSGPMQADYLLGEDVITPGGIRSMQNPTAFGHPDHYSLRYQGPLDSGGVHINSGIPNHVFYLAIEGGRNRVSGLTVQGVGAGNREQIEKVMYRAFVQMMPPTANFADARRITAQAARDLYGAGSPPERAIIQAWDAVGVN